MEQNRFVFTVAALNKLPPASPGQRDTYHDLKEPGLSLRVGPTGKKQFGVFKRTKNGPPIRITLGAFPDLSIEQARTKTLQIKNSIALGSDPAETLRVKRKEMTLGEAFKWFIENHAEPNGLKTIDGMRGDFERYLGALSDAPRKKHGKLRTKSAGSVNWQNRRLSNIKPTDAAQLKASLAKHSGKGAANHAVKLLRSVFNVVIKAKIFVGTNPAEDIGVLKIQDRDRFLEIDEMSRLLDVLDRTPNTDARDFILLAIFTGARKGNLIAMSWDNISMDRAVWSIPDSKNGDPVDVQLTPEAVAVLKLREGKHKQWVFPGKGKTGHLQSPKRGVSSIFKEAGIQEVRIHDLRRTLGSWQAINGSSLLVIGKSLGHKSMASTLIYARLTQAPVRQSVEMATAAMMANKPGKPAPATIDTSSEEYYYFGA
ncbi:site-specific integrase [Pseudoduganella violaceinigra]|uniref:site-specific integrase n=1 Tax=Pseudoduganella violaceinigra TaxID=246602 RepID=UPI00040ABB8D|nr:site-specific integrase [Pseudoduganella violaceinigra]